ncbi:MAG: response regulator [Deltaproteobacteria bacterium]|nr:response regulator [Deltaproteobacteria bacterium]
MEWLIENRQWVFSGIGVMILPLLGSLFYRLRKNSSDKPAVIKNSLTINNNIGSTANAGRQNEYSDVDIDSLKPKSHILFIDDDVNFKVVSILKKSGWINTKRVKDIKALDCPEVRDAQILFIDIQGVGKILEFPDEGLGLASALKDRYPEKKVIIYSAETKGDRFHQALKKADTFLPKNASPYEFTQIVEEFSKELFTK